MVVQDKSSARFLFFIRMNEGEFMYGSVLGASSLQHLLNLFGV